MIEQTPKFYESGYEYLDNLKEAKKKKEEALQKLKDKLYEMTPDDPQNEFFNDIYKIFTTIRDNKSNILKLHTNGLLGFRKQPYGDTETYKKAVLAITEKMFLFITPDENLCGDILQYQAVFLEIERLGLESHEAIKNQTRDWPGDPKDKFRHKIVDLFKSHIGDNGKGIEVLFKIFETIKDDSSLRCHRDTILHSRSPYGDTDRYKEVVILIANAILEKIVNTSNSKTFQDFEHGHQILLEVERLGLSAKLSNGPKTVQDFVTTYKGSAKEAFVKEITKCKDDLSRLKTCFETLKEDNILRFHQNLGSRMFFSKDGYGRTDTYRTLLMTLAKAVAEKLKETKKTDLFTDNLLKELLTAGVAKGESNNIYSKVCNQLLYANGNYSLEELQHFPKME